MTLKLVKIVSPSGFPYESKIIDNYDIVVLPEPRWEDTQDVIECSEPLDIRDFERLVHGFYDLDDFDLDSKHVGTYSPKDWAEAKVLPPESWEEIFNQNYAFDEDDVL